MLLVIAYSREARAAVRNVARTHEDVVVGRFGRALLLEATEFAALHALRLRERHGGDIQVERTTPLNEFADVPPRVREAAAAYADRDQPSTPYGKFAAGRDLPGPASLRGAEL